MTRVRRNLSFEFFGDVPGVIGAVEKVDRELSERAGELIELVVAFQSVHCVVSYSPLVLGFSFRLRLSASGALSSLCLQVMTRVVLIEFSVIWSTLLTLLYCLCSE